MGKEGERKTESQNRDRRITRTQPDQKRKRQKTTVGLRSGSVPPQQLGPGPCLSSFDGLSALSLRLPGEHVFVGSLSSHAERLHTDCADRERTHDGGLSKVSDAKSRRVTCLSACLMDVVYSSASHAQNMEVHG